MSAISFFITTEKQILLIVVKIWNNLSKSNLYNLPLTIHIVVLCFEEGESTWFTIPVLFDCFSKTSTSSTCNSEIQNLLIRWVYRKTPYSRASELDINILFMLLCLSQNKSNIPSTIPGTLHSSSCLVLPNEFVLALFLEIPLLTCIDFNMRYVSNNIS